MKRSPLLEEIDVLKNDTTLTKKTRDDFLVIGAGFGRTGTMSLRVALNILGIDSYHMVCATPHFDKWLALGKARQQLKLKKYNSKTSKINQNNLFENWEQLKLDLSEFDFTFDDIFTSNGYNATVDFPACSFYQELLDYYPNAKVILTVRDSEKYYKSISTTIFGGKKLFDSNLFKLINLFRVANAKLVIEYTIFNLLFDGKLFDKEFVTNRFDTWNNSVIKYMENKYGKEEVKDKLLVFNVKEGWKPLCKFLGKKIPENEKFPHANDGEIMKRWHRRAEIICNMFDFLIYTGMISGIGYLFYVIYKKLLKK